MLAESDATNPSFNGKKIVLNIDATQEKAADICGAVDAMLVMDSRLLKYGVPGMVQRTAFKVQYDFYMTTLITNFKQNR